MARDFVYSIFTHRKKRRMKKILLIITLTLFLVTGCKVIVPLLKVKFYSFSEIKELLPAKKKEYRQNKTEKMDEIYDRMFREF